MPFRAICGMFEVWDFDYQTWNEFIKESDGMANLFLLGYLLFEEFKKFNESCSFSKAARMYSTYLR